MERPSHDKPEDRIRDLHGAAPNHPRERAIDENRAFLALSTVRGIGQKTLFAHAESGRLFSDALEYGLYDSGPIAKDEKSMLQQQWSKVRGLAIEQGDRLAEKLERLGISLLFRNSVGFPPALLELERPPHWLFIQGAVDRLSEPSISIVGTRKPSTDGYFLARYIGTCLSEWAAPTVSGLAAGIDQLAHEHSLRAGIPTIAVLGTGMLQDYPKGSGRLRDHILATGGAIISEYLPTDSYSAENFVQRNRLQAALGRILIPAEWNRRSGTAHTVRFATELGRPIACVRLPEWPIERVVLEQGLGLSTGKIFTLPHEHSQFDAFVRTAIGNPAPAQRGQLSFFGGE